MIQLHTVEEAVSFLAENQGKDIDAAQVQLGGELTTLEIVIEGDNYHSTVPGLLARGLWRYQEEIYRAVAFSLYGEDSNLRLTEEQKLQFELVFAVTEGSTDLSAAFENFLKTLAEGFSEGFKTMTSSDRMKTIIIVAVLVCGGYGGVKIMENISESNQKIAAIEAEKTDKAGVREMFLQLEKTKADQFKIIADLANHSPETKRFAKASEEGTRAIIKGASDAKKIKVARTSFDREAIIEVNQRGSKTPSQGVVDIAEYTIVSAAPRDGGVTRFTLTGPDGTEFSATILDEEFEAEGLNKVWKAVRNRAKVKLEINKTVNRGIIKQASILSVVD